MVCQYCNKDKGWSTQRDVAFYARGYKGKFHQFLRDVCLECLLHSIPSKRGHTTVKPETYEADN